MKLCFDGPEPVSGKIFENGGWMTDRQIHVRMVLVSHEKPLAQVNLFLTHTRTTRGPMVL